MGRADGLLSGFLEWFAWFGEVAWSRRLILAINFVGVVYGFWYYLPQFSLTPVEYWPMVPDSPLAVLWATLALLLWESKRRSPALEGLAFAGNVVIGFWTGFVLLFYDRVHWPRLDFVLFWAHLAMVAQALVFVKPLRNGPLRHAWIAVAAAAAWYGVNVVVDYWFTGFAFQGCVGLHPITIHKPGNPCGGLDVVAAFTAGLSLVTVAALAVLTTVRRRASLGMGK